MLSAIDQKTARLITVEVCGKVTSQEAVLNQTLSCILPSWLYQVQPTLELIVEEKVVHAVKITKQMQSLTLLELARESKVETTITRVRVLYKDQVQLSPGLGRLSLVFGPAPSSTGTRWERWGKDLVITRSSNSSTLHLHRYSDPILDPVRETNYTTKKMTKPSSLERFAIIEGFNGPSSTDLSIKKTVFWDVTCNEIGAPRLVAVQCTPAEEKAHVNVEFRFLDYNLSVGEILSWFTTVPDPSKSWRLTRNPKVAFSVRTASSVNWSSPQTRWNAIIYYRDIWHVSVDLASGTRMIPCVVNDLSEQRIRTNRALAESTPSSTDVKTKYRLPDPFDFGIGVTIRSNPMHPGTMSILTPSIQLDWLPCSMQIQSIFRFSQQPNTLSEIAPCSPWKHGVALFCGGGVVTPLEKVKAFGLIALPPVLRTLVDYTIGLTTQQPDYYDQGSVAFAFRQKKNFVLVCKHHCLNQSTSQTVPVEAAFSAQVIDSEIPESKQHKFIADFNLFMKYTDANYAL